MKIIALLAVTIALAGCQTTQRHAMHEPPKYMTEDDLALWAAGGSVVVILGGLAWPTVVPMVALQRPADR